MVTNTSANGMVLAAPRSGAGKTTLSLGLMAAFSREGLAVQPFKCGPDFIDPTLHQLVTGRISRNLDLRMCDRHYVQATYTRHAATADIAIVEGVMGLFDGGPASTAALAKTLSLPVILVVDTTAAAESVAAMVKGFESLDPQLTVAGVILNRIASPRHLALVSGAITDHCQAKVLGHLPRQVEFEMASRHLGLHMGTESSMAGKQLETLIKAIRDHIDLRLLRTLLSQGSSVAITDDPPPNPASRIGTVRLGVARDEAFCFYYQDNLDLLQAAGATLVPFSPLTDPALPADLDGIYLGGGYPELNAAQLAANRGLRQAIREWSQSGRPLYAECGGFMYLSSGIVDQDGTTQPMVGVFPALCRLRPKLAALGYRQAKLVSPCLFGRQGSLAGHEFHYSEMDPLPAEVTRCYQLADGRGEGFRINNTLGSYLHLHFGSTPAAVENFIRFCQPGGTRP